MSLIVMTAFRDRATGRNRNREQAGDETQAAGDGARGGRGRGRGGRGGPRRGGDRHSRTGVRFVSQIFY